jgi:hypothetical protein
MAWWSQRGRDGVKVKDMCAAAGLSTLMGQRALRSPYGKKVSWPAYLHVWPSSGSSSCIHREGSGLEQVPKLAQSIVLCCWHRCQEIRDTKGKEFQRIVLFGDGVSSDSRAKQGTLSCRPRLAASSHPPTCLTR